MIATSTSFISESSVAIGKWAERLRTLYIYSFEQTALVRATMVATHRGRCR